MSDRGQPDKPWIHFEAGALSKTIENSQINVCPFLFNASQSLVEGPLKQFQSVRNEKDEIFKLVSSINVAAKDDKDRVGQKILDQSFDAFWPQLERKLKDAAASVSSVPAPKREPGDLLEEILEVVRSQNRMTASRQDLQDLMDVVEYVVKRFNPIDYAATIQGLTTGTSLQPHPNSLYGRLFASNFQIVNPIVPPPESPTNVDITKSEAEENKDRKK